MNGFETRVRLFHKPSKRLLPTFPLWKANFADVDCSKYKIMFSIGLKDRNNKLYYTGDKLDGILDGLHINWCDKCCNLAIFSENECLSCESDVLWYEFVNDHKSYSIVGNIFEAQNG